MQETNSIKPSFRLFPSTYTTSLLFTEDSPLVDCDALRTFIKIPECTKSLTLIKIKIHDLIKYLNKYLNHTHVEIIDNLHDMDNICTFGANKWGKQGWIHNSESIPWSYWYDAALRHLYKYIVLDEFYDVENINNKQEKPRPHILCAVWNLAVLQWYIENSAGIDDLTFKKEN